jgi:LemA protein
MPKWVIPAVIVVLAILFVVAPVTGTYNSLVAANQQVDAAWANVEAQYQRRLDLIPNLTEATRGFLIQERTIFEDLAKARARYAGSPPGSSERVAAANQVESALARLLVIVENYPTLRSSEVVQRLMSELASTENEIAAARQTYNQQVRQYNTRLKTFPTVLMARSLGFAEKPYFISATEARQAPKVNLTNP